MHLLTSSEMRECDRRTIEDLGVPGPVLMERAGRGIEREIRARYPHLNRRRIWIVCGRGNNGGDGLVLARLLHDAGLNPRVFLTDPAEEISGDAAVQVAPARRRGIPLEPITPAILSGFERLGCEDLLIDAILGTGFKGTLAGRKAEIVEAINRSPARVIAVDIPSGLSADSGETTGPAVRAQLTVTMGFPKVCFLFWPARACVGEWKVADIGIPEEIVASVRPVRTLLTTELVRRRIRPFEPTAHKGDRGKLLIVGGSPGLTGAPCLAAWGAGHAGAGLVRVGTPRSLNPILETKLTEAMTFPLAETDAGTVAARARDFILSLREGWDALVLGPGLGRHPETDRLVRELFEGWNGPLLIDADGLNALAVEELPLADPLRQVPVLTPHPGEMARLAGIPLWQVTADPIEAARRLAQRIGVVVLLKGAPTVISDPTGNVLVNPTGNPALATGGSGDVLSGIIGALLAQGLDPWWAAGCGAFLHGASADELTRRRSERSVSPRLVAEGLGTAWETIRGASGDA
jgi:ADP-dependent NAD(P)H-hydrate dehydratase / NAD(P)H-hydrate epimerase